MEITEVFYPKNRTEWREWLQYHHQHANEIWLLTYNKASGLPSLPYDDMVEECLCFGWIDGVVKKYDDAGKVQRITPRKKKTFLSELNRQRIWKLQHLGLMTDAGVAPISSQIGLPTDLMPVPEWIEERLKNEGVWETFIAFPRLYQRLKIGWIAEIGPGTYRQEEAEKRLAWLIKMTRQGKRYGTEPLVDWYDFL